jgi:hypothetical protein
MASLFVARHECTCCAQATVATTYIPLRETVSAETFWFRRTSAVTVHLLVLLVYALLCSLSEQRKRKYNLTLVLFPLTVARFGAAIERGHGPP